MDQDQAIVYCKIMSTLCMIGVVYLLVKTSGTRKKIKRSIYQHTIDKYFENMRWYGFEDEQIADMLHDHKSHKDLKRVNSKASKERSGRI